MNPKNPRPDHRTGIIPGTTAAFGSVHLDHIGGLRPLGPLHDLELDLLPLAQRLEAILLDGRKMDKHIFATVLLDEAIALAVVEPLHATDRHFEITFFLFQDGAFALIKSRGIAR